MKFAAMLGVSLVSVSAVFAEEILLSSPIVISPRRIETQTSLPAGSRAAAGEKSLRTAVAADTENESEITIDEASILEKISFKPGSIRLSKQAQKQLRSLDIAAGQKLRISGFGETAGHKNPQRLANLRARVVASFLREAKGDIDVSLQWSGKTHAGYPAHGAIIEGVK